MNEHRFFRCAHCGNMVGMIQDEGVPLICCGQKMAHLIPNRTDADPQKHLPQVSVQPGSITVIVGNTAHPMAAAHHIQWIYLQTDRGGQRKNLSVDQFPTVTFALSGEQPVAVFAYCNLHGLWMTELNAHDQTGTA